MTKQSWSQGSLWLRWDPHLHAPGTLRNDRFGNDWEGYIRRIEEAQPPVFALGITDYFTLRTYKEVLRRRQAGAFQAIPLIFPNVELRLTIETKERQGINLHLLVCPDDTAHVERMEEKLAHLRFRYREEWFPCSDDGLRRLGRAHRGDPSLPDEAALREGANQFKVELSDLRKQFDEDLWMRENVLVAVAAGNDGLAGIAKDASFRAQREELGRFANIVFSGQPSDRSYWLGEHPDFLANGHTPKPCLHGCDAHSLESVLKPVDDRRCWIRGDPTFDSLRQTLVEPQRRSYIGELPPQGPAGPDVIRALQLRKAPWVENHDLKLNDGLITIIGAKGSGKTALADLLAFAAGSDLEPGPASFIPKAGDLLNGLELELDWADGTEQTLSLPHELQDAAESRVRYLSQQFVDRLCALSGLAEPLVEEIERVVFNAISEEDRLQCTTFSELRMVMLENPTAEREAERNTIRAKTRLIAEETSLQRSVPGLQTKILEMERDRTGLQKELATIPVKASDEKVKAQQAVAASLQRLRDAIAAEERRAQDLLDVAAEIQRQLRSAESALQSTRAKYPKLLDTATWELLKVRIDGTGLAMLTRLEREARLRTVTMREQGLPAAGSTIAKGPDGATGIAALAAENERLSKELGLDQANEKRRLDLEKRLATIKTNEERARKELAFALEASIRKKEAQSQRFAEYELIFGALEAEKRALEKLYEALTRRTADDPRLSKLTFEVRRVVDVNTWASRGESLLDLRKPPFNRRGVLAETARVALLPAWERGTPQEVRSAIQAFMEEHAGDALDALAQGSTPLDFGEWLFSTDHISVRYGIRYEGVEIAHLSPGARGVVLLTLYLALDEWDLRPLIIDQPEENLDPSSVYSDLVPFFRDAAKRRQIIMVTHNANLVVNTDSDQVIVADAHRTSPTSLPMIRYVAGGLEDAEIRSHVCRLLEGGEEAFRKRGLRYGLPR
jgi:energy-coupling factor transporter ATP-binding protein EcfA2